MMIQGGKMHKWFVIIGMLCLSSFIFAQNQINALTLTTTSFSSLKGLAKTYTCDDENISPNLDWKNIPENTKSFVLILSDPDAPDGIFYHWVVYNIPPTTTSFSEGLENIPGKVGKNSFGNVRYDGPCPPKGVTHSYVFTLYALDSLLDLPDGSDAKVVLNAAQKHILSKTELSTSFGH